MLKRLTIYLARQTIIGILLAGITSSTLFTSLLIPVPEVQAAGSMCYPPGEGPELKTVSALGKTGGVKLDQAATFLAGVSELTGAYYDKTRDQIVFVGKEETAVPKFDKDDLAVAIKAIFFANANPGVKIEYPAPEEFEKNKRTAIEHKYMHVNYMPSKEGDKHADNPNYDYWKDDKEVSRPNTPYGLEDTAFAKVLFEADLKLKKYFLGFEKGMGPEGEHGGEERVSSNVPGYKPHYQRWVEKNPDMTKLRGAVRVWMQPKEIVVDRDAATDSFIFNKVTMEVTVRDVLNTDSAGADEKWREAADDFAKHHTERFDEFAQETPAYGQVKRLAQIVGVVKWLKDNQIATDFQWARHYEPAHVATPRTTDLILVEIEDNGRGDVAQSGDHAGHSHLLVGGGTNYFEPLTYQTNSSAEASGLKQSALASQPTPADFHWDFTKDGQQYEAIAVSAELFRDTGVYAAAETDLSLETVGEVPLAVSRAYSTQTSERSYISFTSLGKGWDILPARLTEIDLSGVKPACAPGNPSRLAFSTLAGGYETFTYNCTTSSYQPDSSFSTSKLTAQADGTYLATTKDLTAYSFDYFTAYGEAYRLRAISDRNGNTIHYDYHEPSANLAKIYDDHGHFITLAYGDFSRVAKATDWTGRSVAYAYDAGGRLTKVTDVLGRVTQYQYDSKNRLTGIVDPAGQEIMKGQFNELNKITSQTDALGRTTNMTYNETNRTITAQDSTGATNKHIYDDQARLVEATDAAGKSTKYSYGSWVAPETVADKRGNVTKYQYDSRGNVTRVTLPDNISVDTTYNPADLPTQVTDSRYSPSRTTAFTYDAKNNLTKQDTAGVASQVAYDQYGEVSQATGPLGQTTAYVRNTFGLPTSVTDPLGNVTKFEYDGLGRLTKQTDPAGVATTFTYDDAGKMLTTTDAAGTTRYTYDGELDRLIKVTLPDGTIAQYTYNPAGQINTVTDAKGNSTTYTYDTKGNLLSRKTAAGTEYKSEYDAVSRPTKAITPLGKIHQSAYDANGNPTTLTDAANKVVNQEFDVLDRLTKSLFSDSSAITRSYDGRGNVLAANDPAGQLSRIYDQFDRLTRSVDPFGNRVGYAYDASGNRTGLTYASGEKVQYGYDLNSRLTSVTDWNNQATQLAYYPNGLVKEKKLPNGITTTYEYDAANRLSRVRYLAGSGDVLAQTDIERSAVGNITKLTESGPLFTQAIGENPSPPPSSPPQPPAQESIQAHWKVEEDSGTRNDSSANANHLTDNNTVLASTDHKEGAKSADFEADNTKYLSIADNSSLSITGDLTLAGWVKLESLTGPDPAGHQSVITKSQEGGAQMSYHLAILSGGKPTFFISPDGAESSPAGKRITSQTALAAGSWYHLAAVYAAGQSMKVYLNGVVDAEDASGIPGSILDGTAKFMLGAHDENGTPSIRLPLDGLLDDVYVYNKALTASEITQLMQSAAGGTGSGGITTFTYDALGELTKAAYPDTTSYQYAYDAIGNRTQQVSSSGTTAYTYDADAKLNQAGSATFTHDDNGAVKEKKDGTNATYHTVNARQELARVGQEAAPPETWELTYAKQTDSAWNIDIGYYSAPAIADLDADGKLDLLIGEYSGNINHYEQTEAKANSSFTLVAEKLGNIDIGSYSTPDLADMDADGDLDLFIGKSNGEIAHYKNNGSKTSPAFALAATKFSNIDIGSYSTPRFADIDADSDLDLFIGKSDGTLAFYKNIGTSQSSNFQLQSSKFNNWDVGSYSAPVFAKLDSDDDLDLLIGKSDGKISHYDNTGSKDNPSYQLKAISYQAIDVGSYSKPFLQDLTGDGLIDLLIGESGGKLRLYNASKKVTSGPDPGTTFKYDALGNRIVKKTNGAETRYVNDISEGLPYVLAELNSSNQPQSLNLYAAGLTSFGGTASTSRIYTLTDPLGNVRFLTDSTGTLLARYTYDPYGNIRKKEGNVSSAFTFAGEQFDPETSLTFLRARYYDPSTGTFLSRDPVLGPLDTPLEHGEYLYARNNPVKLSDPSGQFAIKVGPGAGAGLYAGFTEGAGFVFLLSKEEGFKIARYYSLGGGAGVGQVSGAYLGADINVGISDATRLEQLAGIGLESSAFLKALYGANVSFGVPRHPDDVVSLSLGLGIGYGAAYSHNVVETVILDMKGRPIFKKPIPLHVLMCK